MFPKLDEPVNRASHVEIIFRDEYLTRADMWRLVVADLSNKMIHKGDRISFMGPIKALIQNIFVYGQKVQSAFFDASTKPIFRSESARYVIFIQMSKEMWDFDADSTGEIMFSKVINGFLPELFTRWKQRNVKHLISIVLFTRMIYEKPHAKEDGFGETENSRPQAYATKNTSHEDFYRVVVSDMAGGEWDDILNQLKLEFKVFLKDVSITRPEKIHQKSLRTSLSTRSSPPPEYVIAGHPSTALRGNILEAINLASSQFSCDHIDRDLVRTGVSIVIITPGTGVFEVDHKLLIQTTEKLIENGVGIDLVCLSPVPLHSVPLFKYWHPSDSSGQAERGLNFNVEDGDDGLLSKGIAGVSSSDNLPHGTSPLGKTRRGDVSSQNLKTGIWLYGIPHWIDVSFWTSLEENRDRFIISRRPLRNLNRLKFQRKSFAPRVRMYQIQMMGVMEDAMNEISIPYLSDCTLAVKVGSSGALEDRVQSMGDSPSAMAGKQLNHGIGLHVERPAGKEAPGIAVSSKAQHGYEWIDEYDSNIFCHPRNILVKKNLAHSIQKDKDLQMTHRHPKREKLATETLVALGSSVDGRKYEVENKSLDPLMKSGVLVKPIGPTTGSPRSSLRSSQAPLLQQHTISHQLSFGPRGFAGALKASASTEITAEHVKSGFSLGRGNKTRSATKNKNGGLTGSHPIARIRKSSGLSTFSSKSQEDGPYKLDGQSQNLSREISIGTLATTHAKDYETYMKKHMKLNGSFDLNAESMAANTRQKSISSSDLAKSADAQDLRIALSPRSSMAPWLTMLNPSNPRKMNVTLACRLGRWQHIFPRPLRASKIKWKSLCSPAAVPLTTEDFPSQAQIAAEYDESSYNVLPLEEDFAGNTRSHDWLLKEMVAFRFTQGFQVVIGSRIEHSMNLATNQAVNIFEEDVFSTSGSTIFMSRGNHIHQLSYLEGGGTAVRCLTRRTMPYSRTDYFEGTPNLYKPVIRTMHAQVYSTQLIDIYPERLEPPWETIDSFIAHNQHSQREPILDKVRSWRARFVLIPVDPPPGGRSTTQPLNEDNDEEIRLEGISKLTQMWQRYRYIPPVNHRFQALDHIRKDTNPLDIIYRTQNPATIIEAELESFTGLELTGKTLQLLPDSHLYQRSNLDLISLAQVMQSEKGVRMMDRRWHLRLHYKCFVGFELTTWLLENFRDVETREEAVELGNDLMRSGLFKHVERRHQFRDGNYFYQIASEYHNPTRSWLGRPDVSVPSTPLSEGISQNSATLLGSHGSASGAAQEGLGASRPFIRKPQLGVALSKSLLYDVDFRKRSRRPEVVTLHYDRLHNPDNCYHILLEWMNCTAKLIEDAVVTWATMVEKFGLRLVELPLGEASAITKMHPFRAPTLVMLAVRPPKEQPSSLYSTTSLNSSAKVENYAYQKAILKKFQFVLDFEAATDFPFDVDVTYSWGRPNYKYPQYIHRSGVTLAQITSEGEFLLLANRLYNNRGAANQEPDKSYHEDFPRASSKYSPVHVLGGTHPGSLRPSPHLSPAIQAAHEEPVLVGNYPRIAQPMASITPEEILIGFEAFCHDAAALRHFYDQILNKALSPGGNSPLWEGDIPILGLPSSLALGEASLSPNAKEKTPVSK